MPTDELAKAVKGQITTGSFMLASGRRSGYYADLKPLLTSSRWLKLIGERMAERLRIGVHTVDAVGGLELFAVPVVAAVLCYSDLRGFVVRKERKDHGIKRLVEGSVKQGDRIAVIDDVATSGGSLMASVRRVESEFGTTCSVAMCVLDRQEGADEHLRSFGVELVPLFRINELSGR